jgi:RNA 2',3'-cyclic 3'-phosphodiesterase
MATLRAFIAIELDEGMQAALKRLQQRGQADPAGRDVRWVAPDGIHLTLKFLGDVDSGRVPALLGAMRRACAGTRAFDVTARGMGCFPNPQRPNVVWVGLTAGAQQCADLARRVEDECAALGYEREDHPFSPHLTLGRVKREAGPAERRQVGQMVRQLDPGEVGAFRAAALYLMRSELKPSGAVYTVLGKVELAES